MADEVNQRLVQSRHYCIDRLAEVKEDLTRLQTEGNVLKTKLETADEVEAGQIRRRRRFLSRRLDELKAERAALTEELQAATARLNGSPAPTPSSEWRPTAVPDAPMASPSAAPGDDRAPAGRDPGGAVVTPIGAGR